MHSTNLWLRRRAPTTLLAIPVLALVACSDAARPEPLIGPQAQTVPLSTIGRVLVTDALFRLVPSLEVGTTRDAVSHELLTLLEEGVPVNGDLPLSRWVIDREEVGADAADLAAIALVMLALEARADSAVRERSELRRDRSTRRGPR